MAQPRLSPVKPLAVDTFNAGSQLENLISMLDNAKDILNTALEAAKDEGTSSKIDIVGSALRSYSMLWAKVVEYREKVAFDHAMTVRQPQFDLSMKSWERTLKKHYKGRGPQYEMLCRQTAEWQARLTTYADIAPTAELKEFSRLHLNYLAELKRHTESTKTANTSDIDTIMAEVIKIVEARLGPSGAPTLRLIIGDVKDKLAG